MREAISGYTTANTLPMGINGDSIESHIGFKEKLKLPFELLTDEDLSVARAYGALKPDPDNRGQFLESVQRTVVIVGLDGRIIFRALGSPATAELLGAIMGPPDLV